MNKPRTAVLPLFAAILLISGACSLARRDPEPAPQGQAAGELSPTSGAIVISGTALDDGPGTLLPALTGKVPNMRVHHRGGQCPEIILRANVSFHGRVAIMPAVYVDGTRTTDTCILEQLRSSDVERVEIYPQGFTTRPGYSSHSHGLILVFMRSS